MLLDASAASCAACPALERVLEGAQQQRQHCSGSRHHTPTAPLVQHLGHSAPKTMAGPPLLSSTCYLRVLGIFSVCKVHTPPLVRAPSLSQGLSKIRVNI